MNDLERELEALMEGNVYDASGDYVVFRIRKDDLALAVIYLAGVLLGMILAGGVR